MKIYIEDNKGIFTTIHRSNHIVISNITKVKTSAKVVSAIEVPQIIFISHSCLNTTELPKSVISFPVECYTPLVLANCIDFNTDLSSRSSGMAQAQRPLLTRPICFVQGPVNTLMKRIRKANTFISSRIATKKE